MKKVLSLNKKFLKNLLLFGYSSFLIINVIHFHKLSLDVNNSFTTCNTNKQNTFQNLDSFFNCKIYEFSKIVHKYDFIDSYKFKHDDSKNNLLTLFDSKFISTDLNNNNYLRAPPGS